MGCGFLMIVKATIDGQDYYLEEHEDGSWQKVSQAPSYGGIYPVTVTVQEDSGAVTVIGSDDPVLGHLLKLIVLGKSISADNMIQYLPRYLRKAQEIKASLESIGYEIDRIKDKSLLIIDDAYILSASEQRIQQWEQKLKIEPKGTLEQRKMFLLAVIRGQGKLNESKIKSVVKAFTGGDCTVTFNDSTITVKILAPAYGDVYLFPDVERSLAPRVPAHIGLRVQRWYSAWNDVKENFADWNAVRSLSSWKELKDYLPPDVGS
jgi:hypothetical protein